MVHNAIISQLKAKTIDESVAPFVIHIAAFFWFEKENMLWSDNYGTIYQKAWNDLSTGICLWIFQPRYNFLEW